MAVAFPGLFDYETLLDLDVRDFAWWERKAKVENAFKKLNMLNAMRLAMHGDESYEQQVNDLVDMISFLERKKLTDAEVLVNWNLNIAKLRSDLEKMKKGKRIGG